MAVTSNIELFFCAIIRKPQLESAMFKYRTLKLCQSCQRSFFAEPSEPCR